MHPIRTALLLGALLPRVVAAQTWVTDTMAARLAWGTANVLLQADSLRGVKIWAVTSRLIRETPSRNFAASFDPDSAMRWMAYAEKVIAIETPPRDSASIRLQTPTLRATDGSQMALVRSRTGKRWSKHPQLYLIGPEGRSPWYIEGTRQEMRQFLQLFFRQAGASSLRPHDDSLPFEPNPTDSVSCPALVSAGTPVFPIGLRYGHGGEVWLTFVIRADGTADPNSFNVPLSDAPDFTRSAIRAVLESRYRPAQRGNQPIDARVHQRVIFRVSGT